MFGGIKDNWHKSKAAVCVETAFSRSPVPYVLPQSRDKMANSLVEDLWSSDPSVFNGKRTARLHPMTVAAASLADGAQRTDNIVISKTCYAALAQIIIELRSNYFSYSLNGADHILIDIAEEHLRREIDAEDEEIAEPEPVHHPIAPRPIGDANLESRKRSIDERLASLRR